MYFSESGYCPYCDDYEFRPEAYFQLSAEPESVGIDCPSCGKPVKLTKRIEGGYIDCTVGEQRANPTAWSSPDSRWRVEEWGPQDFTVVEILSTDPIAAALGEDARVWPARFKTLRGAIKKASKLAGVTYSENTAETVLDRSWREGR